MSQSGVKYIPTSSQTVGPYFSIGLQYLIDRADTIAADGGESITLSGRVLDADGNPVPDVVLEFWDAGIGEESSGTDDNASSSARGFTRVPTNERGCYRLTTARPGPTPLTGGAMQAPHLVVLVFARGLLRHLITRVYFADAHANANDLVLNEIPAERRPTLIAQPDSADSGAFHWDVVLQGKDETVFFAW